MTAPQPERRPAPEPDAPPVFTFRPRVRPTPDQSSPPPPGGPPWGPGGGSAEPPHLGVLLDQIAGAEPGPVLSEVGPACAEVAAALPPSEPAAALLAGVYWTAAVRTAPFAGLPHGDRRVLVVHAGRARYDLLILSPAWDGPPILAPVIPEAEEVAAVEPRAVIARIVRRYPGISSRLLRAALIEIARGVRFDAVLARLPEERPTSGPVLPAGGLAVSVPDAARPSAAVGVLLLPEGSPRATTAWHAVRRTPGSVLVGDVPGRIVRHHAVTDACLIELSGDLPGGRRLEPVATGRSLLPALGEPMTFERPGKGTLRTVVTGCDMSILDPQLALSSKVYTVEDTRTGDSGTALISGTAELIGFASRRSSARAAVRYSTWIWAGQALDALGVTT